MKLLISILILLCVHSTIINAQENSNKYEEIAINVSTQFPSNIKVFECENGNLFLVHSNYSLKSKEETVFIELDKNGQVLNTIEDDKNLNIIGMTEFEGHYAFLSKTTTATTPYFIGGLTNKINQSYKIVSVSKKTHAIKQANLVSYLTKKQPELKDLLKFNLVAFCHKNEIITVCHSKKSFTILKLNNKDISHFQIPIDDYTFKNDFLGSDFTFFESKKTLSIYDYISDNKLFITPDNELIFLYKNIVQKVNRQGMSHSIRSINYLNIDLTNQNYVNKEYVYEKERADAMFYDNKIWIFSADQSSFDLRTIDLEKNIDKVFFINKNATHPSFLQNSNHFYSVNGKERIDNIEELLKSVSTTGRTSLGGINWHTGITISKNDFNHYNIEVASLTYDIKVNPFIWPNFYNINNQYFHHFNHFNQMNQIKLPSPWGTIDQTKNDFILVDLNNTSWMSETSLSNKKWASYFNFTMNNNLTIAKENEDKIEVENDLILKQKFKNHIDEQYKIELVDSAFELKQEGKTIIFYSTKKAKKTILMYIQTQ